MGPPDDATLNDWREAFLAENQQRMALRTALAALEAEMRSRDLDEGMCDLRSRIRRWADRLAALLTEPER